MSKSKTSVAKQTDQQPERVSRQPLLQASNRGRPSSREAG